MYRQPGQEDFLFYMLLCNIIGGLVDCLTVIPLAVIIMLCMLQDRRRPLWPVWALLAPLAVGVAACVVCGDYSPMNIVRAYFLLLVIGLIIYMVRHTRLQAADGPEYLRLDARDSLKGCLKCVNGCLKTISDFQNLQKLFQNQQNLHQGVFRGYELWKKLPIFVGRKL